MALAVFLVVHGLIHTMAFAKAFRLAELPQLTQPIPSFVGVLGLVAAVLFVVTAGLLFVSPRLWWVVGAAAVATSAAMIAFTWTDAKFGAIPTLMTFVAVVLGYLAAGPASLFAEYIRDVDAGLARLAPEQPVTDADLAHLPALVQRFLRVSGVVGQPRVQNVRARMHGRIRGGPEARWMPFTVEQYNFYDQPSRLFYMDASMLQVPIQGYHRYVGPSATMRVKAAGLVRVAGASGSEMTQTETVTLFNDMWLLAPATLIDPGIAWAPIDARTVGAAFTNAGHTIRARMSFNDAGELTDFWSDDRSQASADGTTLKRLPWSTPFGEYRSFGAIRLSARGEARWHEPGGEYAYIQIDLDDVQYNVRRR